MNPDWIWGLIGGLMIGTAGAGFLLVNGRVMGISSIFGGLIDGSGHVNWAERAAFVAGLILLPAVMAQRMDAQTHITGNWGLIIAGGLLVGLGTRLANGCTSGHGVCGISRLSLRGIVASLVYIAAGAITMAALRGGMGWL